MRKIRILLLLALLPAFLPAAAQSFKVDGKGVIRDAQTRQEGAWFGVNYTAPFAHAYRQLHRFGADIKQTIDKDTYHLARMGVNAYRIHVWDYEITDGEGNLLANEHLDLFDYLIARLEERGVNVVLTMIMGGNNGYPEPGEDLPGFSGRMNKSIATSDPDAVVIEENYIRNFLNHHNPYTGHQTKDDPMIVGFEINNEPTNSTPAKETTAFVNRMIAAVRSTGCKKPVFYNVSHNFQNTQAFYDSKMEGGTFQWYPTGLVANHTRRGNYLPAVAEYKIPFDGIKGFDKKARIVYEFDAADQWAAYLYPAIVRSFRTAGFQWVTFFAYDPIDIAQVNTEYQTHYLNLAYTPSKALSFKIAAEAMRALPRGASYGNYPESNRFGDFYVEYARDLSVMNTAQKYFYSNTHDIAPKDAAALEAVAGVGSSPVVQYEGTGAYFLDKVADGIWRLEVMPDQVLLSDPFAKASQRKEVNTILWHPWPMTIDLPDLGEGFSYCEIDVRTARQGTASGKTLEVIPGTWLLARRGVSMESVDPEARLGNIRLDEFVAPGPRQQTMQVLHEPVRTATAPGPQGHGDRPGRPGLGPRLFPVPNGPARPAAARPGPRPGPDAHPQDGPQRRLHLPDGDPCRDPQREQFRVLYHRLEGRPRHHLPGRSRGPAFGMGLLQRGPAVEYPSGAGWIAGPALRQRLLQRGRSVRRGRAQRPGGAGLRDRPGHAGHPACIGRPPHPARSECARGLPPECGGRSLPAPVRAGPALRPEAGPGGPQHTVHPARRP